MSDSISELTLPMRPIAIRSKRAAAVAKWFGLDRPPRHARRKRTIATIESVFSSQRLKDLLPAPGQIVLLTGPSGSGKSSLLRALCAQNDAAVSADDGSIPTGDDSIPTDGSPIPPGAGSIDWIDLARIDLPDVPVVDCFQNEKLERVLARVGRVGLAEVWTYLRTPDELSEGQRWRLKFALAMAQADRQRRQAGSIRPTRPILLADEFAAVLDRVTGCIIAHSLRKMIRPFSRRRSPFSRAPSALVATSHDDLIPALQPDRVIRCDFTRITTSLPPRINHLRT